MAKKMIEKSAALKVIKQKQDELRVYRACCRKGSPDYSAASSALKALIGAKKAIAALGLLAALVLSGCTALRQYAAGLVPGGAGVTDEQVDAVVVQVEPLAALLLNDRVNPLVTTITNAILAGQLDQFGVALTYAAAGQPATFRVVVPAGRLAAQVGKLRPNDAIRVWKHPLKGFEAIVVADRVDRR